MTLDEAIAHHEWAAENCEGEEQRDQMRYHQWLTELKAARECAFGDISMAARATRELCEVKAENANLRALCHDMYQYTTNREMELCNACVEADGDFADCAAFDDYDGACGIAKRRFEELYQERMRELGIGGGLDWVPSS